MTRRRGYVFLGVFAVAASAVAAAVTLFEPTTASSLVVMAAGGLVGLSGGLAATLLRAPRRGERVPTRATERDRAADDHYLAGELRWRWRKAVEGAGISRMVATPSGFSDAVPVVLRTQLRPFTRLTVRLRQGQDLSDLVVVERRLGELMGANGIHIAPLAADVVTIDVW